METPTPPTPPTPPTLINLLGLAVGLSETAEEVRQGEPVDPDYLDRVADSLWAYVGNRDRQANVQDPQRLAAQDDPRGERDR
jgi:hypothetical protein